MDEVLVPTPGSNEARRQGCLCPVIENAYGAGYLLDRESKPIYVIHNHCPLHGEGPEEELVAEATE